MKIECCVPVVGVDENKARNPRMLDTQTNRIRLSVDYHLGGVNCFTYKNELRGYYLHATPEYAYGYMRQCMLGTGVKHFLLEVSRQSKKRAMEACTKAELLAPQLVEWCCKEYGLTVEPTEIKFNGMAVNDAAQKRRHIETKAQQGEDYALYADETIAEDDRAFMLKVCDTGN